MEPSIYQKPVKLFDTESRQEKALSPVDGETFRFYCCGPTVYGPAHIGNFRTFILQDVLRRTLELGGMPTKHVRNITDVDDKTIRDSVATGLPLKKFTAGWAEKFHADCAALNLLPPHLEPSAVEHIPEQISMIATLVEKGHAYPSEDGSVYFKIASFPAYGKLSRLDQRELSLGKTQSQRSSADEYEKDSLADFVLWKSRRDADRENFWNSPWGEGRPGWHLECSAMIQRYLGDTFDLHSGGEDLVFPHHENEIAQSKCACGGNFARHWFHPAHLLVDGGKMSKSKGNLHTLASLAEAGWTAMEVRYVLIGAHYRKQLNFTFDSLHAAREALGKLAKAAEGQPPPSNLSPPISFGVFKPAWKFLNNDLNTPGALGELFGNLKQASTPEDWQGFHAILRALGLTLPSTEEFEPEVPPEIRALAEKRWAARLASDWPAADSLRVELTVLGWSMKDARETYSLAPLKP